MNTHPRFFRTGRNGGFTGNAIGLDVAFQF
jgi:hypothetical protein